MTDSSPLSVELCKGAELRQRQLMRWSARIDQKLQKIGKRSNISDNDAWLLESCNSLLGQAMACLVDVEHRLQQPWSYQELPYFNKLYQGLVIAEGLIKEVEYNRHPFLASRDSSDFRYERLLGALLSDIGLKGMRLLACHKQQISSPMRVFYIESGCVVFFILRSIRSFDALSLAYHEIGHAYWYSRLDNQEEESTIKQKRLSDFKELLMQAVDVEKRAGIRVKRNEIMADVFAGLTGGYAFCKSLCTSLFPMDGAWQRDSEEVDKDEYPSPALRILIAKEAAMAGKSPHLEDDDPILAAWEGLKKYQRSLGGNSGLSGIRLDGLRRFIRAVQAFIENDGIKAAHKTGLIGMDKDGAPVCSSNDRIPKILLAAARYRARNGYTPEYTTWEKRMFEELWSNRFSDPG